MIKCHKDPIKHRQITASKIFHADKIKKTAQLTAWHCMENICKMSFSSTKSWVDTSCTTYLWYNSISSHVTTKTYILTLELLFYLDGCRFTVNNFLILSNCNNNCINTWEVCTIIFRRLLFLKFTTAHRTN